MTRLTVLMSVKNGEPYLRQTVDSILNQTYKDFVFLILDNASTDNTREIIRSFNDSRIRLVELPEDLGQVAALNKGLDMIDTPYVARMDADDISMPKRFERQITFMDQHPGIGICGTFAVAFTTGDRSPKPIKETKWEKPCSPQDIKARLLFGCCMVHPSVMMRKDLLNTFRLRYDEKIGFSEDWELWMRAVKHFDMANIPEYLLKYRIHDQSVSVRYFDLRQKVDEQLIQQELESLGLADHPLHYIHKEVALATTYNARNREPEFIPQVLQWFGEITTANQRTRIYDDKALQKAMRGRLFIILRANARLKGLVLKIFFKERLYREAGFLPTLKFLAKVFRGT